MTMQVTIHTPAAQAYIDAHPQLQGDINGGQAGGAPINADDFLDAAPAKAPPTPQAGASPQLNPTTAPTAGTAAAPMSADDFLKNEAAINPKMKNEQILSALGMPDDQVKAVTKDPLYKALNAVAPDFLAQEAAKPGSTIPLLKDNPAFGAFVQSADQSAFGVARLMTHALASTGAIPQTSADVMDAWSKVNDLAWPTRNSITPQDYEQNYTVPKIAGAVALGAGASLAGAATGVASGLTDVGVAAGGKIAQAIGLKGAAGVVGRGLQAAAVGGAGATGAAAYANPSVDFSGTSEDRAKQYWQQSEAGAKEGALFAGLLHGAVKGGSSAISSAVAKSKNAAAIAAGVQRVMSHVPTTQEGYQYFMKHFSPLFKTPAYAEREANFAMNQVNPKLSQVTHGAVSKGSEKLFGGLPFGLTKFNAKQGEQLSGAAQRYSAAAYDKMINTKFSGMAELEEAAKSGGAKSEAAQRILEEFHHAGLTPARTAQLSAEGEGIRKWLIGRKKFAKVQELAKGAAINTAKPLDKVNELIKELAQRDNPDSGLLTRLTKMKANMEGPGELNTWGRFEGRIEELAEQIKKYQGTPTEGKLIELQRAMKLAQHEFAENIHKYSKSERFGIMAKDTAPYFKASKGEGYNFPAMRPEGAAESEPGVRMYATPQTAAQAATHLPEGELMAGKTVKLRSPVIVEGAKGLNEFKQRLGLPVDNTFKTPEALKADWDAITQKATEYSKSTGHDGVVFTKDGVPQSVIDMTSWKKSIGEAATNALKYYRENIGAEGSALKGAAQSLKTANPDNIIDKALDKKGAETATNYFKSLDDKGRAAIRVATIERAIKLATDEDGNIKPQKIAKYFHDRQDAVNVFFKGEDKWALNGFVKLMNESKAHTGGGGHGLTGSIVLAEAAMDIIKSTFSGNFGEAAGSAIKAVGSLSGAGAIAAKAATSAKFRYFLTAASDAAPGSPAMQKIYAKMMDLLDTTAAATAAKEGASQ